MRLLTRKTLTALAVGVFCWLLARHSTTPGNNQLLELAGQTMGTGWHVVLSIPLSESPDLDAVATGVTGLLEHLDRGVFSTYVEESELSRLNKSKVGEGVVVSRELLEVLLLSRTINQQSYGTFDITVGPLVNLWGFGPQKAEAIPTDTAIAAALRKLGADRYDFDARASKITRLADINIDLSAIAKGYAVDKVAELLLSAGFANFLVEIGGEVRVQGTRQPEQGWRIGIETPQAGNRTAIARIDNRGDNFAMAGSGDYRNFFELNGKRYSHEIDPHTGKPVEHALAAVTVLAATAAEADAWATAMMVLGPIDGPLLAEQRKMPVYFIIRNEQGFETLNTPAFLPYLTTVEVSN